ncbi:protein lin-52 homolog isoform X2 [Eublepharis macularius]|uniref:Protein lin-52 homolog n=1 Tax=Eublepharis macularius TaxID=481883 RepID=A0AA97KS00_EUBMA|nr:protein lin-52 homolog isoform X2 [Eublepharis macularius]
MAGSTEGEIGADLEASLLSFEKLDRASPDLWPEQLPGVAEFAASFKSPITSSPPKWMAELENDDIDMLKELGSLTTANLMEKVRGLQNLAYQLGLDEFHAHSTRSQASSGALLKSVPLQDICKAATWASADMFVKHYALDVLDRRETAVGTAVLQSIFL